MAGSTLVPGYPAINKPQTTLVSQGGAIEQAVTAASLGAATGTVTCGNPHSGDVVKVTINGHEVDYTVVVGDTTATILAGHVASAINGDGTDSAIVTAANNASAVVTITAKSNGTVGCYSLTAAITGSGGTTAVAGSPALTLGGGNTIVPKQTFQWNFGGSEGCYTFYDGFAYNIDSATATAIRAAGYAF